jgi:nicotinamide-nucleotide amidase
MNCEIITVGDELLIGQVINTNQAFIARALNDIGVVIDRMTTAGDNGAGILDAFRTAWARQDLVVVTGGLGPTHDDITRTCVCSLFNTELVSDPGVRKRIEGMMKRRNLAWSPAAEDQTLVPKTATPLDNPVGTAPGLVFEESGKLFIVLPGVPYEMEAIVRQSVVPLVSSRLSGSSIRHRNLRTAGISESLLSQKLGPIDQVLQGARLAFLPTPTGVRLRIDVHEKDEASALRRLADCEARIREKVGRYIYGIEDDELEDAVGALLAERNLTLGIAESCTGGLIAHRITQVSGSSRYFDRGVVAYSNRSKTDLLGVPEQVITRHGAVSAEVAKAMAQGIRTPSDIGISTTGIAGPTGGTPDKPVGLVWIGYADAHETLAIRFHFGDHRQVTKERASSAALELLRRKLLKIPESD